jgi:hypothetical protein
MPLTVLAMQGAWALVRARRQRSNAPIAMTADRWLAQARRAAVDDDRAQALAAATKAIEAAIAALDGHGARATSSAERRARIEAAGGDEALVARVDAALDRLGAERYTGVATTIGSTVDETAGAIVAALAALPRVGSTT